MSINHLSNCRRGNATLLTSLPVVFIALMTTFSDLGHGFSDTDTVHLTKGLTRSSDGISDLQLRRNKRADGALPIRGSIRLGSSGLRDLERQIRNGVTGRDSQQLIGAIDLDSSGSLQPVGDLSNLCMSETAIAPNLGQPRTIALYASAEHSGSNATFEIVGFVGIRIVACEFHDEVGCLFVRPTFVI